MKYYIDEHLEWDAIYGQNPTFQDIYGINDISEVELSPEEIKILDNIVKNVKEKEKMDELELLDKVIDAATFLYVKNMGDKVAPNILVSKLPNKTFYVSLNRYITPTDRFKKTIMFKTTKNSSKEALMDVAKFLAKQKITKTINPLEELEILIDEENLDFKVSLTPGVHNW